MGVKGAGGRLGGKEGGRERGRGWRENAYLVSRVVS